MKEVLLLVLAQIGLIVGWGWAADSSSRGMVVEFPVYLPTTLASDQAARDSEPYKTLKAEYNSAVAQEISAWIAAHPAGK